MPGLVENAHLHELRQLHGLGAEQRLVEDGEVAFDEARDNLGGDALQREVDGGESVRRVLRQQCRGGFARLAFAGGVGVIEMDDEQRVGGLQAREQEDRYQENARRDLAVPLRRHDARRFLRRGRTLRAENPQYGLVRGSGWTGLQLPAVSLSKARYRLIKRADPAMVGASGASRYG